MKHKQLLFGRKPVIDALQEGQVLDRIILQRGIRGEIASEIRDLANKMEVPIQNLPKEAFRKYGNVNHQGVIGFIPLIPYQDIEQIIPFLFEQGKTPLILVLDNISDVRNFGAIARSAEVLGADAILIPVKGAAQLNDIALKISAGALRNIPVCRTISLRDSLKRLRMAGLQIIVADQEGGKDVSNWDLSGPTAIVLGAEGKGVHPSLKEIADVNVFIPQKGDTDSLNVSVAAGIFLYEVSRQRAL